MIIKEKKGIDLLPVWLPEGFDPESFGLKNQRNSKIARLHDVVPKNEAQLYEALEELKNLNNFFVLSEHDLKDSKEKEDSKKCGYTPEGYSVIKTAYGDFEDVDYEDLVAYNPLAPSYQFLTGHYEQSKLPSRDFSLERLVNTGCPEWIFEGIESKKTEIKAKKLVELNELIVKLENSNLSKEQYIAILKQIQPNLTFFATEILPNIEFVRRNGNRERGWKELGLNNLSVLESAQKIKTLGR